MKQAKIKQVVQNRKFIFALLLSATMSFMSGIAFSQIPQVNSFIADKITAESSQDVLYTLSIGGIEPVQLQPGLPKDDMDFISTFYGSILDTTGESLDETMMNIRDNLTEEFSNSLDDLQARYPEHTETELFFIFVMLRVAGSFPVYDPQNPPSTVEEMMTAPNGNCSTHSIRTMMILEAFEIPSNAVTIWTQSIPGHIVATSRMDQTAVLIDVTGRSVFFIRDTELGFFETLSTWTLAERKAYFADTQHAIVDAPFYYPYFNPGILLDSTFGYNRAEFHEINLHVRSIGWYNSLTTELPMLVDNWDWEHSSISRHPFTMTDIWGFEDLDFDYELSTDNLKTINLAE